MFPKEFSLANDRMVLLDGACPRRANCHFNLSISRLDPHALLASQEG